MSPFKTVMPQGVEHNGHACEPAISRPWRQFALELCDLDASLAGGCVSARERKRVALRYLAAVIAAELEELDGTAAPPAEPERVLQIMSNRSLDGTRPVPDPRDLVEGPVAVVAEAMPVKVAGHVSTSQHG